MFGENSLDESCWVWLLLCPVHIIPVCQQHSDMPSDDYSKGVVFYLQGERRRIVGVLTWNLFGKMDLARAVSWQETLPLRNDVPSLASFPGAKEGEERAPGTHCLRMRLIATEFRGDRVRTCANSVYQALSPPPPPRLGTRLPQAVI